MNNKGSSIAYTLLTLLVMVAIVLIGVTIYKIPKMKSSETEQPAKTASAPKTHSSEYKKEHPVADTVALNGKVYTVNEKQPWAEAVAIKGTDIVYVGDNKGVKKYIGEDTTVADMKGKFMMPGIVSTHEHALMLMGFTSGLMMEYTQNAAKMLAAVKEYVKEKPDAPMFSFGGAYEGRVDIFRQDIDKIIKDKPFLMIAASGHGGWCNTKALEVAGIKKGEPDPIDSFGREEDGTPNGYVASSAAVVYMLAKLDIITQEAAVAQAPKVLDDFAGNGVTAIFDAGAPAFEKATFAAMGELEKRGELTMRISASVMTQREYMNEGAFEKMARFVPMYNGEFFKVETFKIHADGSYDGWTAGTIEPYADKPESTGITSFTPELQQEITLRAAKKGYDIHVHTIGYRTVRQTLDTFEAVRKAGYDKVRLTTAHTSLVHPDDKPRFKELDVIVNTFAAMNAVPDETNLSRLGKERYHGWGYQPMKSFLDIGVRVTMSADSPTAPLNPMLQISIAMARKNPGETEFLPPMSEALSLEEAIRAYTIDSAFTLRWDDIIGSIEVGKRADLIVLDRNLFECTTDEIAEANVLATMVNGKVVHEEAVDWSTPPDILQGTDLYRLYGGREDLNQTD